VTTPERKPVSAVKRSLPEEGPVNIPNMAQRKKPSCLLTGLLLLLIAGAVMLALWHFGLINFPSLKSKDTPTATLEMGTPLAQMTATETPTATPQPSLTATVTATSTATMTPTAMPTATEKPMPFIMKGTPELLPDSMFFQGYGCAYLFIGGQVWNLQDAPIEDLNVHLSGSYGDELVEENSLTGSVTAYGDSGYGFILTNQQIEESSLFIQLEDETGNPLSSLILLKTSSSCQENLMLVNFKQVR
jgi:hypothetical protein